jgi:hypothetical protein
MIRAQSNNMPNYCWNLTKIPNIPNYFSVDFQVAWNSAVPVGTYTYTATQFSTAKSTTEILCDIQRTSKANIPSAYGYNEGGATAKDSYATAAGLATTGLLIFNGLAMGNVDAVVNEGASMDKCMEHPSP